MGEVGEWLGEVQDELLDAGLSKDDFNDAVDFINYLEDEDEDDVLAEVIPIRAKAQ